MNTLKYSQCVRNLDIYYKPTKLNDVRTRFDLVYRYIMCYDLIDNYNVSAMVCLCTKFC